MIVQKTITLSLEFLEGLIEKIKEGIPSFLQVVGDGSTSYDLEFGEELTQQQLDDLDSIISAYSVPKKFKIYQYVPETTIHDPYIFPADIDYKTGLTISLFPARVMVQGELQEVTYYAEYDALEAYELDKFKQPVLKVEINYTRDSLGFAQYRSTTRSWYYEDGTMCTSVQKITSKVYDFLGTIAEGKRRRQNIIDGSMIPVLGMMIQTCLVAPQQNPPLFATQPELVLEARRFLSSCKAHIIDFVDDSSTEFSDWLSTATEVWLNNVIHQNGTTIRQWLMNEIDVQVIA